MKKIISVILCMLCLSMAVLAITSCKPEEDPYEMMYGEYLLKEVRVVDITDGRENLTGASIPQAVTDKIAEIKDKIGDTVTITKEKITFSKGNATKFEFEYKMLYSNYMSMLGTLVSGFPFTNNISFTITNPDSNGIRDYAGFSEIIEFEDSRTYEIAFVFVKPKYL